MQEIDLHTELNALGIRFEPIGYAKSPNYPYGTYFDDIRVRQPDENHQRRIVEHEIEIALYAPTLDALATSSTLIDAWINGIPLDYSKNVQYVIDEKHYCATFTLGYTTKRKD